VAESRDGLFARLSAAGRECAPVGYRFVHTSPLDAALILRLAESRPYRSSGYLCGPFRKPISKCCGPDEDSEDGEDGHG
jgi:hypothetical protein